MIFKIWFVIKTLSIIAYELLKYFYTNNYNQFIINITRKLSNENIFYGKIIQAISTNNNLINQEVSDYLLTFTDNVLFNEADIDIDTIDAFNKYNILNGNVITNIQYKYPINSGLISLVYLAKFNDKDIVIKIKRNNITYILNDAFEKISFFIRIIQYIKYINHLHIDKIFNENKQLLLEQLDFVNEVNNIKLFNKNFKNVDYIMIPNVYEEFTNYNHNLIVMDYIKGKTINEVKIEDKNIYASLFSKFFMKCIHI